MTTPPATTIPGQRGDTIVRAALDEIARQWRYLLLFPFVAGVLAFGASFLITPRYAATTVFTPAQSSAQSLPASLSSIAAQFGFALPSSGYSVYYYAEVLDSRRVLAQVAKDTLRADGQTIAVMDMLGASGPTPERRLDDAIRILDRRMSTSTDDQANLVSVEVEGTSPALAEALGRATLGALDSVVVASQRTGGSYQRRFAEAEADSARNALHSAEDELRDFYRNNRSTASSPALQEEEGRLHRQIDVLQSVYVALVQQAESAKLDEARDTPSIDILQQPLASPRRVWPRRSVLVLFGMIGAGLLALFWLYLAVPALRGSATADGSRLVKRLIPG